MNKIFLIFVAFLTVTVTHASDFSVVVDGKTFFCSESGEGSPNCSGKIKGFQNLLDSCLKTFTVAHCYSKTWPKFKAENPSCIYEAIPQCMAVCEQTFTSTHCAGDCQ